MGRRLKLINTCAHDEAVASGNVEDFFCSDSISPFVIVSNEPRINANGGLFVSVLHQFTRPLHINVCRISAKKLIICFSDLQTSAVVKPQKKTTIDFP